jgi:hypothetical protein
MDDLIDMMVSNESPADISDRIKEILMQKSAENIDIIRPVVASSMFGRPEMEFEKDSETEEEYSDEEENQEEDEE